MKTNINSKRDGLIVILSLSLLSYGIVKLPAIAHLGLSSLIMAILLGIIVGNLYPHPASWTPGIQFAAKRILRLAIILYGFRISFQEMASLGIKVLMLDIFIVSSTLCIGFLLARKLFKLDRDLSLLISAGSAICGAAAVLAVEDVLKSKAYQTSVAIATVVLFGTLAMFLYPLLQGSGIFGFNETQFGIFTGASIHEVAQALVAGSHISSDAGKLAVIVKMIRVILLVPVLFILVFLQKRIAKQSSRISIPWFALGFLFVICFNSLNLLPVNVVNFINEIDLLLLTMAMAAIGLETKLNKMKQVGLRPFYAALFLFVWLMCSAFFIVKFI